MKIRDYAIADYEACMRVFRSNVPKYFLESEISEFSAFLQSEELQYLVVEQHGAIVACGGSYVRERTGRLCWGMVEHTRHRTSIGSALLVRRINMLFDQNAYIQQICIDTSQFSAGFFERFGFKTQSITVNGFSQGLDCVEMTLSRLDWHF